MSDLQNTVNAADLKAILEYQLSIALSTEGGAAQLAPLMVWGAPGVGKSTIIRKLCEAHNIGFIDIRLSQREPVDLRGLPVARENHVDWLLAGEWPRDPNSKGIILFDEITAADRALQVAAYEIILDRRLGDLYELPKGWLVMAAGNRNTDQAVAYAFSSALANRFCHLELAADVDTWALWAREANIAPEVVAFVRFQQSAFLNMEGNLERGWPSPRSWERVSNLLNHNKTNALPSHLLDTLIQGLVGTAAAVEFMAFLRQYRELPDIQKMLARKAPIKIPKPLDLRFAFCGAVLNQVYKGDKLPSEALITRFFEVMLEMGSDFATMMFIDAITHADKKVTAARSEQLITHELFEQWSAKHGVELSERGGMHGIHA